MTDSTTVVMTCAHVRPEVSNERFTWLGRMLYALKPDRFVCLGDFSEMDSLSSFDTRYPKQVAVKSYQKDIDHSNDADERLWHEFRKNKKGMPIRTFIQGNHEYRIDLAIKQSPYLEGKKHGVSLKHLNTFHWDDVYRYENSAPAIVECDGNLYTHFVSGGSYGRALDGVNHGLKLVEKLGRSVTVGHSHRFNYHINQSAYPNALHGLVAGCFIGEPQAWAGQANNEWTQGVAIQRFYGPGCYDLTWVSIERMEVLFGD